MQFVASCLVDSYFAESVNTDRGSFLYLSQLISILIFKCSLCRFVFHKRHRQDRTIDRFETRKVTKKNCFMLDRFVHFCHSYVHSHSWNSNFVVCRFPYSPSCLAQQTTTIKQKKLETQSKLTSRVAQVTVGRCDACRRANCSVAQQVNKALHRFCCCACVRSSFIMFCRFSDSVFRVR
jgi:hypothetical protein